ncbi:MAG TPA: rhomboid family intramembrane serine protease [Longimicrobium sp.]|uniref:rhomboid family intramembrane serine protease n=1 Tax=Longimicrobium sp. TaxID=2029185 RepID=UPI002EDBA1A8
MQDPSPPHVPPCASTGAQPWRMDEPLHPHHAFASTRHGYLVEGRVEPCERGELAAHLAKHPWTEGVYVPGATGLARPEDVPGLLDEHRREAVRMARRSALWTGLFAAAAVGFLVWAMVGWDLGVRSVPGLMAVFGLAYLGLALHGVRAAARIRPDVFVQARQARRHWEWAKGQPGYFTWTLAGSLCVVFLFTMMDEAIPRAALVKQAVWDGEAWRMLTGPMLHGGLYHVWMNVSALLVLGRIMEAHTTRHHVAAVFLCSVIGGSALSVLLSPRTSVGASGGVMGLVGFLWMMARLRPRQLPDDFGGRMNYAIGATALLGVIGFEFIDNWAHLGGLLAGAGAGWLLLRDGPWERRDGWLAAVAGTVSLVILLCAMFGAIAMAWDPSRG